MVVTWWWWWWQRQYSQTFIVVVELLSCVQLFVTPWTAAHQAFMSFTISWSLLTFISIESVMLSNQLNFRCPLLFLPSVFSQHGGLFQLFTSSGQTIGASASSSVLPMNIQGWFLLELTGLILQSVQGTLKSLPQHHSWKESVLRHSAFFMVQLSHPHMTGKTIALPVQTFVQAEWRLCFLLCCVTLS